MENNNLYSHENFGMLFNPVQHEAEFFAEVSTMGYTDFRKIEESDGYRIRENFNC